MWTKLEDLEKIARNVGLEINIKKITAIRNIMMQSQSVENADSFCYLCVVVTKNGDAESDVINWLNKATAAIGRHV